VLIEFSSDSTAGANTNCKYNAVTNDSTLRINPEIDSAFMLVEFFKN